MHKLYVKENTSSREFLKEVLKKYNVKSKIITNEYGKPYLENNELYFNISHSGDYTVIAVGDSEIGVDIQKLSYKPKVIKRFYNEKEKELATNEIEFTKIWTIKEAYVKKIGIGLGYGLENVDSTKVDNIEVIIKGDYVITICY